MAHAPWHDRVPPELLGFLNLPPRVLYSLADRGVLELGVRHYRSGRVLGIRAEADRAGWILAEVRGKATRQTRLAVIGEEVQHACDCPRHAEEGVCPHVVAALLYSFRLFQGRDFGFPQPHGWNCEQLREEFLASTGREDPAAGTLTMHPRAAKAAAAKAVEPPGLRLGSTANGFLTITTTGKPTAAQLNALHFHGWGVHRVGDALVRILGIGGDPGAELVELVADARRQGLEVHLVTTTGERWTVTGRRRIARADTVFDLHRCGTMIRQALAMEGLGDQPVIKLTPRLFLLNDGTILEPQTEELNPYEAMLHPHVRLSVSDRRLIVWAGYSDEEDDQEEEDGCPEDRFNELSLAVPLRAGAGLPERMRLAVAGGRVEWSAVRQPEPVRGVIRVEEDVEAGPQAWMQILVGEYELPVWHALAHCLIVDLAGERFDRRLTRAKGRLQALLAAARKLLMANSKKARREIVDAAAKDPVFVKGRLQAKARKWLQHFERVWAASTRETHLVAVPGQVARWMRVESPARMLAAMALFSADFSSRADLDRISPRLDLSGQPLGAAVRELALLARAFGFELTHGGFALRQARVEISLDVLPGERIDWFELKPELRCGSLTIPQPEWERLIRGELLLKGDDGWILPELEQKEALERLCALSGGGSRRAASRRDSPSASVSIPRLQILDWLELRRCGAVVRLPDELQRVFDNLLAFSGLAERELPAGLEADLRDYQRRGFEWLAFLHENRFGACLADDMGLGKTLQALALVCWRQEARARGKGKGDRAPHLVVVPPSLMFNWRHEAERFAPGLSFAEYHGLDRDLETAMLADVVLTTYDLLRRDIERFTAVAFDLLILDEAQAFKNTSATRTRAVHRLRRRFTLCLTGTPMENHVGEYFSIMNLAVPGIFGEPREFRRALTEGDERLLARARPFVLRRTKAEILTELPPKVESDVYLEMTAEQKEIYTRTVAEVREEVLAAYADKTKAQAGIVALAALLRLRQVCVSPELLGKPLRQPAPKIAYLLSKLEELRDEGQSALVFSQFTRSLDLLEAATREACLPTLRLDGSVPAARRKQRVHEFQTADSPRFFLISLRAGGVGLNLTRAQTVFHADPWWNPAVENQASDRAHRIGQENTVFIQRLLMRHSVEEKLMALKARKQRVFDALMRDNASGRRPGGAPISREDFDFLLG
jgi:superfamily II DNA or RNA helicase